MAGMKCFPQVDEPSARTLIDSICRDLPKAKLYTVDGNSAEILEMLCQCIASDVHDTPKSIVFNPEERGPKLKLLVNYMHGTGYMHWIFRIGEDRFLFLGHLEKREVSPAKLTEYSFDKLVDELTIIWRTEGGFVSPDGVKHLRVVEIGNILNQKGGFAMMQDAARTIGQTLGGIAVGRLDKAWNGIGNWEA